MSPCFCSCPQQPILLLKAGQIMSLLCNSFPGLWSHWKPKLKSLWVFIEPSLYLFYISYYFPFSFTPLQLHGPPWTFQACSRLETFTLIFPCLGCSSSSCPHSLFPGCLLVKLHLIRPPLVTLYGTPHTHKHTYSQKFLVCFIFLNNTYH